MLKPNYLLKDVYCVTYEFLQKNNIKAVVFDIDNTLVGFTVKEPTQKIIDHINNLKQNGIKVAIASNNNKIRVGRFCENLDVLFVHRACKPLPFALLKITRLLGVKCKETMLVGDQVYTDSLGANFLGMTSVMVDIIDTKETLLFKIKRALEKPVINAKIREDNKQNG